MKKFRIPALIIGAVACVGVILYFITSFTYTDRPSDQSAAQQVSEQFYDHLKANRLEDAYTLFHEYELHRPHLEQVIKTAKARFGDVQEITLKSCTARVKKKGFNTRGLYTAVYTVERLNSVTKETIKMALFKDTIKMIHFEIERSN